MKIDIRGDQVHLSPAIKKYIEEKLSFLSRFIKRFETKGELLMSVEIAHVTKHHKHGEVFFAGARIRVPGKLLEATHFDKGVRDAVDALRDKMKTVIQKYKGKKIAVR